ncbi:MAG TPA: hypothetical protein DD379_06610 [Cyanobacteria bacterium UBA11162]|nr:hypothetical protein [Cyanobacteria bacterium UBA11162]
MPEYNLTGLSTRSFEQLIQAIALKVVSSGVIVYGDGPDGGREATFEGETSYPEAANSWNGYIVIQAKFRQRPQENTEKDGEWALEQLKSELEAFSDSKKTRRKPDYYIFATNVVLTPVQDKGSKDKAYNLIQQFSEKVPLKDYDIWDYDKIRSFLDSLEEIRKAYAAWITPGDVLSEVIASIKPSRPDFEQVISNFLQKELVADQYANLEQAGHANEKHIPLAYVFTDLPFSNRRVTEPVEKAAILGEDDELSSGIVARLIETSRQKFDPESVSLLTTRQGIADSLVLKPQPGRLVVIGGPGQGKTTVSQFLCQLFRAAILTARTKLLETGVKQALNQFESQCSTEGIELPTARRFPIRIVLSDFATALATRKSDHINSLLAYITDRIRKRTSREVSIDDLRQWLQQYPWLIILDGLDEVPASSNRDEVLTAVQDFWIDAADSNADIMVVATTRPQGYNQDFSPELYRHVWLAPLSPVRALYYARRLTEVRYTDEPERQEKILTRLERAAENEATTRLMRSPLQVTIMTVLVDRVGQPPQERWNLFKDYYKVIYEREVERNILASQILREYKVDVDIIHKRVGLLLQIESERSGRTDARLSSERFAEIVEDRLAEEEHEKEERNALKKQIIEAAANRLVFLVGLELDEVGFEIRSLQEFMASEALMDGSDEVVRYRLEEISSIANWRNVFLFSLGKCFTERQYLRDNIYSICAGLNESDDICSFSLAGSQLALDILEDGSPRRQPKYLKMFARLALRLLDVPSKSSQLQLADSYVPELESLYKDEIGKRIIDQDFPRNLGAWICLIQLTDAGIDWAKQLCDSSWLRSNVQQLETIKTYLQLVSFPVSIEDSWAFLRLRELLPKISPSSLRCFRPFSSIIERKFFIERRVVQRRSEIFQFLQPAWLGAIFEIEEKPFVERSELIRIQLYQVHNDFLNLGYCPTVMLSSPLYSSLKSLHSDLHSHWKSYIEAISFSESPSKKTLAQALQSIAENYESEFIKWMRFRTPWQISACLASSSDPSELLEMAAKAEDGELGDIDEWLQAEERWSNSGLTELDLLYADSIDLPFNREIGRRGFPFSASTNRYINRSSSNNLDFLPELIRIHSSLVTDNIRHVISRCILFLLREYPAREIDIRAMLPFERFQEIINDLISTKNYFSIDQLYLIATLYDNENEWIKLIDIIGRSSNLFPNRYYPRGLPDRFKSLIRSFASHFSIKPELVGILRLISFIEPENIDLQEAISTIPKSLLEITRFSDFEYKESAAIISLIRGDISLDDIRYLADLATKYTDKCCRIFLKILSLIREGKISLSKAEKLLMELSHRFPQTDYDCFEQMLEAANELLTTRTSNLGNAEVWSKLGLPVGLGRLVLQFSHKQSNNLWII